MLVDDLKEANCKNNQELYSKVSVLMQENDYSKDDLEHCIDWLCKSMCAMEKTFNKVKYDKEIALGSLDNVKDAYEQNLKNNTTLSNEAKGFAYKLWRYHKKKDYLDEILCEVNKSWLLRLTKHGNKIRNLIKEMEDKHKNYDTLLDIDMDEVDKKIKSYMERPIIFDPKKISAEEFERLAKEGAMLNGKQA